MEEKKCRKEGNLENLKKQYFLMQKKYRLPDFKFLNETFEIENIEIYETELLLKMIRKHITEKVFYILRMLETLINPSNAPMFIFNILKSFNDGEKEMIKTFYERLSKYEVEAFGL